MHINWFGQTCFKIQENGVTLAIDPYKTNSLKSPRMAADILLVSSGDFDNAISSVSGDKFVIDSPGEYEVKKVFIEAIGNNGVNTKEAQTFFYIDFQGITLGHLGRIKKGQLKESQLELFENVDVLFVPIGGSESVTSKEAAELVNSIEPKIIIPMYYQIPKLKQKLESVDDFKKQMGVKTETADKLSIKPKEIPQDEMLMYILNPNK